MSASQYSYSLIWSKYGSCAIFVALFGIFGATPAGAQDLTTSDLASILDGLQQQLQQVQSEAVTLQRRSLDLEQRLQQALSAKAKAEQDAEKLRQELAHVQERLAQTQQAMTHAQRAENEAGDAQAIAEQGLTNRSQELLGLQADLARALQQNSVLERQLEELRALRHERVVQNADLARLDSERKVLEDRYMSLERQIADLREQQRKLQEIKQANKRRGNEEIATLKRAVAEKDRTIASLRARLPAPEGGTLSAEEATRRAANAAEALSATSHLHRDPSLRKAAREAENALYQAQLLLSRTLGARSVYRVHPNDTLAAISRRFYANSGQWTRIFEANRHLLQDPNRLMPGISLVIP